MLQENVNKNFENALGKFINNDFRIRNFPNWLYEAVIDKFDLPDNVAYETFFTAFFLTAENRLKFIYLCEAEGYGPYNHVRRSTERMISDLQEYQNIAQSRAF